MANIELKPLPLAKLESIRARFARQKDKSDMLARLDSRIAAAKATKTVDTPAPGSGIFGATGAGNRKKEINPFD